MCDTVSLAEEGEFRPELRAVVGSNDERPAEICEPCFQVREQMSGCCVGELRRLWSIATVATTVAINHSKRIVPGCSE